ncbi:MAG: hypothetical protein EHM58_10185 [Ignavibacteriae bacterium]|nr:MAG: hypothetical protein EHM58_10185 [Ignavibacteriota bacterium]
MDNLFLVLSLFLPRLTLIIYFFFFHIPPNNVPFIGDILLGVFLPRVLVVIYIADNLGTGSPWFWIHIVAAVVVYLFSANKGNKRWRKNR